MVSPISAIASIMAHAASPELPEFAEALAPADAPAGVWIADKIGGESLASGSLILLELHPDGACSGSGGCNRFRGRYKFTRDTMRFDRIGGGLMACSPALAAQEQRFFKMLEDTTRWRRKGSALMLLDPSGAVLVRFKAQSPAASIGNDGRDARQIERNKLAPGYPVDAPASGPHEAERINAGGLTLTIHASGSQPSGHEFVAAASVNVTTGGRYAGERLVWWTKDDKSAISKDADTPSYVSPPIDNV